MRERVTEEAFKKAFFARVKLARESTGMSAKEMATALGISLDKYYRYESRHMMRHDLIPVFCQITKIDIHTLLAQPQNGAKQRIAE